MIRHTLVIVAIAAWCAFAEDPPEQSWTAAQREVLDSLWLGSLPPLPASPDNAVADDVRAAKLGRRLFFDTRLSANGRVSCATCHDPQRDFLDGKVRSQGLGFSDRRAMTVVASASIDRKPPCRAMSFAFIAFCRAREYFFCARYTVPSLL